MMAGKGFLIGVVISITLSLVSISMAIKPAHAFGEVDYNGKEYFCIIGEPWTEVNTCWPTISNYNDASYFCLIGKPWTIINTCIQFETDYTNNPNGLDLSNHGLDFGLIAEAAGISLESGWNLCPVNFFSGVDIIASVMSHPECQGDVIGWSLPGQNSPGSAGPNNSLAQTKCATGELVHLGITWDGDIHADLGADSLSSSDKSLLNDNNLNSGMITTPSLVVEIPYSDRAKFSNLGDLRGHQTLKVCGQWVTDTNKGEMWNELHPISSISIIDPSAMTISVPSLQSGSFLSGAHSTVSGTVADSVGLKSATISIDGGSAQSLNVDSGGAFSYTFSGLSDGLHTITIEATDNGGRTGSADFSFVYDSTPPTVKGTINRDPDSNGWYNHDLIVTWKGDDGSDGSGVKSCDDPTKYSGPDGDSITLTGHCTDNVDNQGTDTVTIKYDATPPEITSFDGNIKDGDSFYFGNVPSSNDIQCQANDATSGLDSNGCQVTGYDNSVGTHTLTAKATDNAGNTATQTITYKVLPWTIQGFQQPIDNNGVLNTAKAGKVIPVKWRVFAGTQELTDTSTFKSLIWNKLSSCDNSATIDPIEQYSDTAGSTTIKYDSSTGFIINSKVPTTLACYKLVLTTADGSSISALFKVG